MEYIPGQYLLFGGAEKLSLTSSVPALRCVTKILIREAIFNMAVELQVMLLKSQRHILGSLPSCYYKSFILG